jgi:hypothetical protein
LHLLRPNTAAVTDRVRPMTRRKSRPARDCMFEGSFHLQARPAATKLFVTRHA